MDSINQEQPEQNRADLVGSEAVEKVQKLVLDDSIEGTLSF